MELETQVLEILTKASTPVYVKEIATQLGVSVQKITYVLMQLRKKGVISSKLVNPIHNTCVWPLGDCPDATPTSIPIPDLDKEHEQWMKKVLTKKPVYNPR